MDKKPIFWITGAAGALGRSVVRAMRRRPLQLALLDLKVNLLAE